jgi:hypothetical protein
MYKNPTLKNSCCVCVITIPKVPEPEYPELYTQWGQRLKIPNSFKPLDRGVQKERKEYSS